MSVNLKPLGDALVERLKRRSQERRHHHSRYRQGKTKPKVSSLPCTGKTDDNGKKVRLKSKRATAC